MNFCTITLVDPTTKAKKKLTWKLMTNSVVDKWAWLVTTCNRYGPYAKHTTWGMFADASKQNEIVALLNDKIIKHNDAKKDTVEVIQPDALNFKTLNALQSECRAKSLDHLLPDIYSLFKILEVNDRYVSASFSTYLFNYENFPIECPLKPDEYKHFTLGYSFGDLMLGHTAGKSLFHIYKDQDYALLRGDGPTPQRSISTNILAMFYEGTEDKVERDPFNAWCIENKIKDYENIKNGTGNIILGRLVRSPETSKMSKKEFIQYYSSFSTIETIAITATI